MNCKNRPDLSDSEESCKSVATSDDGTQELSIVAEFDELMKYAKLQRCDEIEDKFLEFVLQTQLLNERYKMSILECRRLQAELEKKTTDIHDLEHRIATSRKLVDQEKKRNYKIQEERDLLEVKLARVAELLFTGDKNQLPEETRQQLSFLDTPAFNLNGAPLPSITTAPQLSTIREGNTTGSLLSDSCYSLSEDGLDTSIGTRGKSWKIHRPSSEGLEEPAVKKYCPGSRKSVEINSNDQVRATTTLTVDKGGPITATSIIEAIPFAESPLRKVLHPSAPPEHLLNTVWQRDSPSSPNKYGSRQHHFQSKTVLVPGTCGPCGKRIGFARIGYRCKDCHSLCHPECKDKLPLPCIPVANAPTQMGLISDYTPPVPPMIPALIIHCTNEIEARGLKEVGLYRIPGSEKEVKMLKEKLIRGKNIPSLKEVDVHVLCGTVKDFLRFLNEPIVTYTRWLDFVRVAEMGGSTSALFEIIEELPQSNRDTLAHMILHLKRIASEPECKMPITNLARIFAPTIVGYSSNNPDPATLMDDTRHQIMVMESLLNLPGDYFESLLDYNLKGTPSHGLQQTPSTDSLLSSLQQQKTLFSSPKKFRRALKGRKLVCTPSDF